MSVQAMGWVLEHSKSTLATRLVALAIANHALPCGCNAFPSIRKIGGEARVDKATVIRAIQALAELGELEISPRPDDARFNSYRLTQVANCDLVHDAIGRNLSQIGRNLSKRALYKNRPNHARAREADALPDNAPLSATEKQLGLKAVARLREELDR